MRGPHFSSAGEMCRPNLKNDRRGQDVRTLVDVVAPELLSRKVANTWFAYVSIGSLAGREPRVASAG